ncbi:MAG: hypothetical protein NVS1B13_03470 [Flavisolibacter sp.]
MDRNKMEERGNSIPNDNPSKAMDSRKEVEQSNDEKIKQDFPGYPHYPAKEDMMDQRSDSKREDVDVETLPTKGNFSGVDQRFMAGQDKAKLKNAMMPQPGSGNDELKLRMGNEADVNEDDLQILNATNSEIGTPQNVLNEDIDSDLDIPGSELDDEAENIGEEDEENNYYSLGGDRHEGQEENPDSDPLREG